MMPEDAIRDQLTRVARASLDAMTADTWLAMLEPGLRLRTRTSAATASVRQSRLSRRRRSGEQAELTPAVGWLGGLPVLPVGSSWPTWAGHGALAHIATLDCSALHPALPQRLRDAGFPQAGWLSFFYFDGSLDGGVEVVGALFAGTAEGAQVMHTPAGAITAEMRPPTSIKPYPKVEITAEPTLTWATWEHPRLYGGGRPADGWDQVFATIGQVRQEQRATPAHQVGGNPTPVQGPVEYEVAYGLLSKGGVNKISRSDPAVTSAADDLLLLGQFDSDNQLGFMWGDCGALYYLIRPADLTAGRFDRVAFTWQCS